MFKKAFQIVVTFGVLLGGYQAYLLGFAALTDRIGAPKTTDAAWVPTEAITSKVATRLASESFGKNHWAAQSGLKIRFYDAERGFYMYARNQKPIDDGKKFEFWEFAIIWLSKDGRSRKTATSDRALIELNQKMGVLKPGQDAMHVVAAKLEGNVELRDDKGTLADRLDDLVIGPLPYIEYTEKTNPPVIRSTADIKLVDRDLTVTGYDLLIELRRSEGAGNSPAGFDAERAFLKKNPHIVVNDVGKSGILPGTAKATTQDGPTPLDLTAEGEMRIDFPPKPKPARPGLIGPPELEGPTYATFQRLVVVNRGRGILKDKLACDTLRLTLLPSEKALVVDPRLGGSVLILGAGAIAPGAGGASPRYGREDGPLTELAIREANAKGYSVWLSSVAQGMNARCDELIYKKLMPFAADETYLRGNPNRPIFVEKIDHAAPQPNPGPVTSVTSIWAADAKIFDDGKGGSASTIVARGPGKIETRPAADKPAEHAASWKTELVMRTIPLALASIDGAPIPTKRLITLNGDPKLEDFSKAMKLEAKQWVIVSMLPKAKAKESITALNPAPASGGDPLTSGSYQIEWVQARENVRLTSPGKTMVARDELNAPFEQVAALASEPVIPISEEPQLLTDATPVPPPTDQAVPPTLGSKAKEPAPKPVEPNVIVTAHKIWAKMRQSKTKSELAEARLRGQVKFHQDAAPDKKRGTDVAGEALDIESVGNGKMKFRVYDTDPSAMTGRARLAALGGAKPVAPVIARIDTEDYTIIGPIIGMDQTTDYASVPGPGQLIQRGERGFLNDRGIQEQIKAQAARGLVKGKAAEKKADSKIPFTITWTDRMEFFGNATDPKGRPSGKAQFRGGVVARMEDGLVAADEIDTYTNRPVSLSSSMKPKASERPKAARADTSRIDEVLPVAVNREDIPEADPGFEEPKTELVQLDARNSIKHHKGDPPVNIINIKRDPETGEKIEVQQIQGEQVVYDKRTGDYSVPGIGMVYLWRRSATDQQKAPVIPGGPVQAARPRAVPIANVPRDLSNTKGKPDKEYSPWELTQIHFEEKMVGRFGFGTDKEQTEARTADFYGAVQVITAIVRSERTALSFDARPKGFKRMTADSLRVVSFPPPIGAKGTSSRIFVTGENNAQATTETHTIAADILRFDSDKDLFYAYGLEGRDVSIVNQTNPGQPTTNARSKAAYYNHRTGAAEQIDPSSIQLLDGATGVRPNADVPGAPAPPKPRNTRPPLRPPARNSIERQGFGGNR